MPVKQRGAIYLQRDRFQVYYPGSPSILEFRFVPQVVRDMDVVNQEMFGNLIKVFVTNSKIVPCNFIIAIADNASFIKDFLQQPPAPPTQPGQPPKPLPPPVPMEELEKQVKDFFSFVPFEEVASKSIPLKNGIRAYATNKDLFEAMKLAFEANGFEVSAVIPALAFGPEVNTKPAMDGLVAGTILRRADSLIRDYNLLNQPLLQLEPEKEVKDSVDDVSEEPDKPEKQKSQLPLLLGVLGVLLLVLAVVAWTQLRPQPKQPADSATVASVATHPTSVVLSPTSPADASASALLTTADNKLLTVQITNASSSATAAVSLHDDLEKFGFKSLTVSNQQNIGASGTSITFSKSVSSATRSGVIAEVQKFSSVKNILDKADAAADITIILTK